MKIKTKLLLGIGLLFVMIVLLTVISISCIHSLSRDARNILTDNYQTIDYCRQMSDALNDGIGAETVFRKFRACLALQQATITEAGEEVLTARLLTDFTALSRYPDSAALVLPVRKDLADLMLLNMLAIQRKNALAAATANKVIFWIAVSGTLCFLCALTLLINLPAHIANPIRELNASIKQIAARNYAERVRLDSHSEFGELAQSFNTMAEQLEAYSNSSLARLMMEKQRIETLINNMSEPVIGLDEQQRVLFINDIALQITGLSRSRVIGQPVADMARDNDLLRLLAVPLAESSAAAERLRALPVTIYADGKESYFQEEVIPIRIIPAGEQQEKYIGSVILLQNITPYKELDFARTNFIAIISHELKTPIAAIRMSLQLMRHTQIGPLNAEQQELLDSITDDTDRLLKITGELLHMAQVDSGQIRLSVQPAKLQDMISYALNATKAAAEQKQVMIRTDVPDVLPEVLADSEKTAWVLTNLLSNAIRYSYAGSLVRLAIATLDRQVRLSVIDSGKGIPAQYLEQIFDRYFRIPGSGESGTGLGLSISKAFVEAQGGQITVDSVPGAGSTFSIYLNRAGSEPDTGSTDTGI